MPDVKAGGAYVEIGAKYDSFKRAAANIQRSMKSIGKGLKSMGTKLTLIGSAISGPMAHAARSFAYFGDSISKTAQRLGVGAQELSEFHHVAELSGVATRTLDMAWQRMTRRVSEAAQGTDEARNALKELGLSAQQLNALSPDKQFDAITEAMQGVANQADRVRLAMRLFDSEGVSLVQIMSQGTGAINAMRAQARELGIALDQDTSRGAVRLKDNMQLMSDALQGLRNSIASAILPMANEFLLRMTGVAVAMKNMVNANPQLIEGLMRVGVTLAAVGATMAALGTVMIAALNPALPIIAAISVALLSLLESLGVVDIGVNDVLGSIWDSFTIFGGTLKDWTNTITNYMTAGFWSFADAVVSIYEHIFDFIAKGVEGIANVLLGTLGMIGVISEETFNNLTDQVTAFTGARRDKLASMRADAQEKMSRAFDAQEALNASLPEKNKDKPTLSASLTGTLDKLKEIFGAKFKPFDVPQFEPPETSDAPNIPGVPKTGVAGFFGGMNAREQMGGVGNVERQQLSTQQSMLRTLHDIRDKIGDGAVYS